MAGILTINSTGRGTQPLEIKSGHSWITYQSENGETLTFSTWGKDVAGLGRGFHKNHPGDKDRKIDVSRTVSINNQQEKRLFAKIDEYKNKGEKAWKPFSPCSTFAADCWEAATNEKLSHRSGIFSNPSQLKESIKAANEKSEVKTLEFDLPEFHKRNNSTYITGIEKKELESLRAESKNEKVEDQEKLKPNEENHKISFNVNGKSQEFTFNSSLSPQILDKLKNDNVFREQFIQQYTEKNLSQSSTIKPRQQNQIEKPEIEN